MARSKVGTWGHNLAVRVPVEIARIARLKDGESVEIEVHEGDILVHRPGARARAVADAEAAAREIIEASAQRFLGGVTISQLIDEGRRG